MASGSLAKKGRFVRGLVQGLDVEAAAASVSRSARTGRRWLGDPEVRRLLADAQDAAVKELSAAILAKAQLGVQVIGRILSDPAAPMYVQLGAAKAAIDASVRLIEFSSLSQRVADLERQVADESRNPGRPVGTGYGRYR